MKIEEIYTQISIWKKILEWNLQLANASWCQRKRWHHLLHVTHIATCGPGIVIDVTKVGHAQNIHYQRIVL